MLNVLKVILLKVFSILPDSPFQSALADMDLSFVPTLNWFIPFDVCADIMQAWLVCVFVYYVFTLVKGLVNAFVSKAKVIAAIIGKFFV